MVQNISNILIYGEKEIKLRNQAGLTRPQNRHIMEKTEERSSSDNQSQQANYHKEWKLQKTVNLSSNWELGSVLSGLEWSEWDWLKEKEKHAVDWLSCTTSPIQGNILNEAWPLCLSLLALMASVWKTLADWLTRQHNLWNPMGEGQAARHP